MVPTGHRAWQGAIVTGWGSGSGCLVIEETGVWIPACAGITGWLRNCLNCDLYDFGIALIILPVVTDKGLDSALRRDDGSFAGITGWLR